MKALGFKPNRIMSYAVRRAGNVAWCEGIKTLREAKREAKEADRVCCEGHQVYAAHENGETTGPY